MTVHLIGFRRTRYGKAPRIRPVRNLFQFLYPFGQDAEMLRVPFIGVDGLAVYLDDRRDVVDALHAAFDFQAA